MKRRRSKKSWNKVIAGWMPSIEKSGYRSMLLSSLLHEFGYKKRGPANMKRITEFLNENGLYIFPKLNMDLPWKKPIHVSDFPEQQYGNLFTEERKLEKFILDQNSLKSIGIVPIEQQFSPDRASHRIDILGRDHQGNLAVIELKKRGTKSHVIQVLEYAALIKEQYQTDKIRKILITGKLDKNIALAIHGLNRLEKEGFEWYVYNYQKDLGELSLIPVSHFKIDQLIKRMKQPFRRPIEHIEDAIVDPGTYLNELNETFQVLGEAEEHERHQKLVVYRTHLSNDKSQLGAMTKESFLEEIKIGEHWRRRYMKVKDKNQDNRETRD